MGSAPAKADPRRSGFPGPCRDFPIFYAAEKLCYGGATASILLDDLTTINLSFLLGAAALALLFVGDGFPNDDDDDSSGGGLMQPVGAGV